MVKEILDLVNDRPVEEQEEKSTSVSKKVLGIAVTTVIDTCAVIGAISIVGLFSVFLLRLK